MLGSLFNICNALRVLSACRSSCPTTSLHTPPVPVSETTLPHSLPSTLSPAIVSRMQRLKIKCRRITKQAASLSPLPVASCELPVVSWQLHLGPQNCCTSRGATRKAGGKSFCACKMHEASSATCEIYAHTYVECTSRRRQATPTTRPCRMPVYTRSCNVSLPPPSRLGQLIKIHEKSSKARINFEKRKKCAKRMRKEI